MSDIPNYLTVKQFTEKHAAFPVGGIRHLIFHEKTNGFDSVITRVGSKVLINESKFFDWIAKHSDKQKSKADRKPVSIKVGRKPIPIEDVQDDSREFAQNYVDQL